MKQNLLLMFESVDRINSASKRRVVVSAGLLRAELGGNNEQAKETHIGG
jgi:hypothetical protein